jgi:hypothetical protein
MRLNYFYNAFDGIIIPIEGICVLSPRKNQTSWGDKPEKSES